MQINADTAPAGLLHRNCLSRLLKFQKYYADIKIRDTNLAGGGLIFLKSFLKDSTSDYN